MLTKVPIVKAMVFPELDHKESCTPKNWRFWTVLLEKTLESPLDSKIKAVNPKGNQSWIFIGRTDAEAVTPILWPHDAKNWLTGKDPDSGKGWRQEKGMTEDEMVGWHHWLNDMNLSKLWEILKDREAWRAAIHGIAKSQTELSEWNELRSTQLLQMSRFPSYLWVNNIPLHIYTTISLLKNKIYEKS